MKRFKLPRMLAYASVLTGLVGMAPSKAATLTANFNTDPSLAGFELRDPAVWVANGGVDDSGYISITDSVGGKQGAVLLPDLDAGGLINGFKASLKLRMGDGSGQPADGFTFSMLNADDGLVNGGTVGEEGAGVLAINLDTYDNGGEAPALEVKSRGAVIARARFAGIGSLNLPIQKDNNGNNMSLLSQDFESLVIDLKSSGNLSVSYKGVDIFKDVPVNGGLPITPQAARFIMGARTGGERETHWVDDLSLTTLAATGPYVTGTSPKPNSGDALGDATVNITIQDGTATKLKASTVVVTFDDQAVKATVTKDDATGASTVSFDPAGTLAPKSTHKVSLTFSDDGAVAQSTSVSFSFTTSVLTSDTFFIEAEDFNHDGGQFDDAASAHGYAGDTYNGLGAVTDVDYHDNPGGDDSDVYRSGEDPNVGIVGIGYDKQRSDWQVTTDYKVGWNDAGDWLNYTRTFPPNVYNVYARLSTGGSDNNVGLSIVTTDPSQPDQATKSLGRFYGSNSGGWDNMLFVPLRDDSGNLVTVHMGGKETVRVSTLGGNDDFGYLAFVPTGGADNLPALASFSPADGSVADQATPLTVTVSVIDQSFPVSAASVKVTYDGSPVAAVASKSGSISSVTFAPGGAQNYGAVHTIGLTYTENGAPVTKTASFQFSGAIVLRLFNDINGTAVDNLFNDQKFVDNAPDDVSIRSAYELSPFNIADNYGGQFLGYIVPTVTDDYTFYESSDDGGRLYLSTDESPANKVLIAEQPSWNGSRQFIGGNNPAPRKSAPIHLEAGKKYFTEGVWKEGGGGDNFAVAWTRAGNPADVMVDGHAPISANVIPFVGMDFDRSPKSQTVNKGLPVTFTGHVVAADAGLISYQWTRNGVDIPGETGQSYTLPAAAFPADNGAKFVLVATLGADVKKSVAAVLTVINDSTPPAVLGAYADSPYSVLLTFSEPLAAVAASNFTVDNGVAVTGADALANNQVRVATGHLSEGVAYHIAVAGVSDAAGNVLSSATAAFALTFSPGFASDEFYKGIGGNAVADLTGNAKFPNSPDEVQIRTGFEGPVNYLEAYGSRLSGWFAPQVDGDYVFFMSSDDNGELWLSTDDNPANKIQIGAETNWSDSRSWTASGGGSDVAQKRSDQFNGGATLHLLAGKKYYLEALGKEGGGGDNLGVAVKLAADPDPVSNSAPISGKWMGIYSDPVGRSVSITTAPADAVVDAGKKATFTGAADVVPAGQPLRYQWQKNGVDIAGATGATYTTPNLTDADDGAAFTFTAWTLAGVKASATAHVQVGAGSTPATVSLSPADGSVVNSQAALTLSAAITLNSFAVDPAKVSLSYDGTTVPATASLAAGVVSISYKVPGALVLGSSHTLAVTYTEHGAPVTQSAAFKVSGAIVQRIFSSINGTAVSDLTNDPKYTDNAPDTVSIKGLYELDPHDFADNYGGEFLGYIVPDVTDDYTIYFSADDNAKLYLSTDASAVNKRLIGHQDGWSGFREFVTDGAGGPVGNRKSAVLHLVAGQKYFTQGIWKEGGGGDNFSVAWTRAGNAADKMVNGHAPIANVLPFVGVDLDAVPASATINKGLPVTFSGHALAADAGPIAYQWTRNGQPIVNANSLSYSIPAVTFPGDNGAKFALVATMGTATVTSPEAVLTVIDDTTAPTVTSAYADSPWSVLVTFSEPVVAPAAANFAVSGGVTVSGVTVLPGTQVRVATSHLTDGTEYTFTAKNLADPAGNVLASQSLKFTPTFLAGSARDEFYKNIGGGNVSDLTSNPRFPNAPDEVQIRVGMEGPVGYADNYGSRLTGWFAPQVTGDYVFFLSADDHAELWISTDDNPANKAQIAAETQWSDSRSWISSGGSSDLNQKRSDKFNGGTALHLVAGSKYYLEALQKEGGGGDNLGVAVKLASDADPANGSAPISGAQIGIYVAAAAPAPVFTKITANATGTVTVEWTGGGTLQYAGAVTGPWIDATGATSPYTFTPPGPVVFGRIKR